MLLQMIEKRDDQRSIDGLERQLRWRSVQPLLRELQQQAESITVRTDCMRASLPLPHEPLSEESFQQWSEVVRGCFHDWLSQQRSRRDIASRINSGQALRYQYVSLMWTCPR
jgi:hypothetical protein